MKHGLPKSNGPIDCPSYSGSGKTTANADLWYAEFQPALFADFDIQALFERRLELAGQQLSRIAQLSDDAVSPQIASAVEPLRPFWDQMTSTKQLAGPLQGGGECFEYLYRVPYEGDASLWMLNPYECKDGFPEGCEYRGNVETVILATADEEASRFYGEFVDRVEWFLAEQQVRITAFNSALPYLARARARESLWRSEGPFEPASTVH
jgi:hypothetical protein